MKSNTPTQHFLPPEETEKLYKSILKSLPLTSLLCDRNKTFIGLINPTSLALASYHIRQYIGKNFPTLLHLPDFPLRDILLKFDKAFDKLVQSRKAAQFEYEFKGEYFSTESAFLGEEYIVFYIQNTTIALKEQINDKLRQSKLKTELAMKAADIMLWEFDTRTQLFTCENEPLNGYDSSQLLSGNDYATSRHPTSRNVGDNVFQRMCTGEDWSFTFDSCVKLPGFDEWHHQRLALRKRR